MYDVPFRAHLKRVPAVLIIFIPYAIKGEHFILW